MGVMEDELLRSPRLQPIGYTAPSRLLFIGGRFDFGHRILSDSAHANLAYLD